MQVSLFAAALVIADASPWSFLTVGLVGGGVMSIILLPFLKWLLVKLSSGCLLLMEWAVFRLSAFAPGLAHYFYRRRAEQAWGGLEGLILPDLHLAIRDVFVPLQLKYTHNSQAATLSEVMGKTRQFIILGNAGAGKTTLAKHLILQSFSERPNGRPRTMPVLVKLRELAAAGHSVEEAVCYTIALLRRQRKPSRGIENLVWGAARGGRLLLVLDGLDEVPEDGQSAPALERARVVERIKSFCAQYAGCGNCVLVTCRESSFRPGELDEFSRTALRIQPFNSRDVESLLARWPTVNGRSPRELIAPLNAAPRIRDACQTPLFLTLLVETYLGWTGSAVFQLPRTRKEFYERALRELLVERPGRRVTKLPYSREAVRKREVLQLVACQRFSTTVKGDREEIPEELLLNTIRERFPDSAVAEDVLRELVESNGILGRAAGAGLRTAQASYLFPHRTILEYLAAYELRRSARVEQVLRHYQEKDEFFQMILWYCSVVDTVHDAAVVIGHYAERDAWNQAADCLLAADQVEDAVLVERVTRGLLAQVERTRQQTGAASTFADASFEQAWERLSALSEREGPVFQPARSAFEQLLQTTLATDASPNALPALKAKVLADPIGSLPLLHHLLDQPSSHWGVAAVQFLAEQADEPAIQLLVKQLNKKPDHPVRREAARQLCKLLPKQGALVRRCAELVPAVVPEPAVWPLDRYFPSRLAMPLIDSLKPQDLPAGADNLLAIRTAVAVRDSSRGRSQRLWKKVVRDYYCSQTVRFLLAAAVVATVILWLSLSLVTVGLTIYGAVQGQPVLIAANGGLSFPERSLIDRLIASRAAAGATFDTVDKQVPRKRELVGTFEGKVPIYENVIDLPDGAQRDAYTRLKTLSEENWPKRVEISDEDYAVFEALQASPEQTRALRDAIAALPAELREGVWEGKTLLPPPTLLFWHRYVVIGLLIFLAWLGCGLVILVFRSFAEWGEGVGNLVVWGGLILMALATGLLLWTSGPYLIRFTPLYFFLLFLLLAGALATRLTWNNLIDAIPQVKAWSAAGAPKPAEKATLVPPT